MSEYLLISVLPGASGSCKSHKDIPVIHLFGNTNWEQKQVDDYYISFTCLMCGEVRLYQRKTERTLL